MKAMPALFAPDVAPRTNPGDRKIADGESGRQETGFTRELRKRENPERQIRASGEPVKDGKESRGTGGGMKMEGAPSLPDPELSARPDAAGDLYASGHVRRGRPMGRQGDTPAETLPDMDAEMSKGIIPAVELSSLPLQAAPLVAGTRIGKVEGGAMPETDPVLSIDGLLPDAGAEAEETMDSALAGELRTGRTEVADGRGRLRHAREMMRLETVGGEERMPMKVVSASVERHLEPAGTLIPGGREGLWRGAAAQVLAALDEGLVPHALAGLDGTRTGGPKVIRNLEIQLHPASLGTVTARLTITGGNMEITISVPDRRLADQMERGLDQLVRRIRARDHGSGQTVVHLVTEPQNQPLDRLQQQLPGQPAADGRPAFGGHAREQATGGHDGRGGHGSADAHAEGGTGHDGMRDPDGAGHGGRRGGVLYL